jgi:tetratricopeptide (TPR) repeat protein
MDSHPATLRLSKGFWSALALSGLLALTVYYVTLSAGVFPGYPAALTAEAARLIPPSGAAHPIFSLVARLVAAGAAADMPFRINLFCAVCGVLCGMLLGYLTGRAILCSATEEAGGEGTAGLPSLDDADAPDEAPLELSEEISAYNHKVQRIAWIGGVAANLLLAFSAPVWAASVRTDNGVFSLLLALLSFALFPVGAVQGFFVRLTLSVFLFTLGAFESPVFLVLAPGYAFFLLKTLFFVERRKAFAGCLMIAAVAGMACAYSAAIQNTGDPADFARWSGLLAYARALLHHYLYCLRALLPNRGWLLILLQVGFPVIVLLFGWQTLFKDRRASTFIALLLTAACVLPGLLYLPFSSLNLYLDFGRQPVFSYAVLAAAAAMSLSACLAIFCRGDLPDAEVEDDDAGPGIDTSRRLLLAKGFAGTMAGLLLLAALAVPWRGWREVDTRPGMFADRVARELLNAMHGRVCLVSNGVLDNHLLLQAYQMKQPLTLITLRTQPMAKEREMIGRLIATSPLFEGLNRQRLQNALSIGTVRFVMEWLTTDPRAEERVMIFATPELWTACGYRAVPEGLAFGGVRNKDRALDMDGLVAQNRRSAERSAELLSERKGEGGLVGILRGVLRMKTGFAANELGVLLEEAGRHADAFEAYQRAVAIDPMNVSAAQNSFALADTQKLCPAQLDALRNRAKTAWASCLSRSRNLTAILQNYGTVRHPALYAWQRAVWSARGAGEVASDKIRKALTLSERTGAAALIENAWISQQAGETAQAEASYLAVLEQQASNADALLGLCMLMLSKGDTQAAEHWLTKARAAGVSKEALRYPTVMVLVLKKAPERAQALEEATQHSPNDVRYWMLLADLLLEQGEMQKVEFTLVPAMIKAMRVRDHFMAHVIRGMVLRKKGPAFNREARQEMINALNMNAALPEIWNLLLELDLVINNSEFTESDARKCLIIDPDHALANYLTGSVLLSRGALKESEDFLRRSIEKRATSAACNDLGNNLLRQKRAQEAEPYPRKALEMDSTFLPAVDTLACILNDLGRHEEAVRYARQAVDARPDLPAFRLTLLRALVKLGDKAGVSQQVTKLSESLPVLPDDLQKMINAMP